MLEKLERLLSQDATARVVSWKHDAAYATLKVPEYPVKGFREVQAFVVRVVQHQWRHTSGGDLDDARAFFMAQRMLDNAFEQDGGFQGAVMEAMQGIRGGPRALADALWRGMKMEQERNRADWILDTTINPMSFDQQVAFCKAILDKYASFLPADIRSKSPAELAGNYKFIIRTIVHLADIIRRRLGKYDV